jgi:hypothetical protein
MLEFIRDAGYGIYPTLLFATGALAAAIRYAAAPRRDILTLATGTTVLTLLGGALGTVVGMQTSAAALPAVAPDERWIFFLGLRESLNNLVAALVAATLVTLIVTFGAARAARGEPLATHP